MTRVDSRADDGSALVEFVYLAVLLLVPLVYVVLTAVAVQRAAFGVTAAARDAGRAYATAGSDRLGESRAEAAVALAMHDQGATWTHHGRVVDCGPCDYAPGTTFTVSLQTTIPLPLMPSWLCGSRCATGIVVSAHHEERISCYSGTATSSGSC
jgi:hypothetical protein